MFAVTLSLNNFYHLQAKYIAQCMEEIKLELRQDNIAVKANAVAKLTYVSLLFSFDTFYLMIRFYMKFLIVVANARI